MTAKGIVLACRPGAFEGTDGVIYVPVGKGQIPCMNWDEAMSRLSDEEVVKAVEPEAVCFQYFGDWVVAPSVRSLTRLSIGNTSPESAYADARKRIVENLQEKARTE